MSDELKERARALAEELVIFAHEETDDERNGGEWFSVEKAIPILMRALESPAAPSEPLNEAALKKVLVEIGVWAECCPAKCSCEHCEWLRGLAKEVSSFSAKKPDFGIAATEADKAEIYWNHRKPPSVAKVEGQDGLREALVKIIESCKFESGWTKIDTIRKIAEDATSKQPPAQEPQLIAKLSDLATEMEKHSNDHLHDENETIRAQAAVEGVCADRIKAVIKPHGPVSERFMQKHYGPSGFVKRDAAKAASTAPKEGKS